MPQDNRPDEVVQLLMQKYSLLKQEIWMHSQHYERHINYLQFSIAGLLAALVFLFSKRAAEFEASFGLEPQYALAAVAFLVTSLTFLLVFKVLETNYRVYLLAACMSIIEDAVNARLGQRVLFWESLLAERFSAIQGAFKARNPSIFMTFYHIVIVLGGGVALPIYLYYLAWQLAAMNAPIFGGILILEFIYTVGSAIAAVSVGYAVHGKCRIELKGQMLAVLNASKNLPQSPV